MSKWNTWRGGECPLGPSDPVRIRLRDGFEMNIDAARFVVWRHFGFPYDTVAYQRINPISKETTP